MVGIYLSGTGNTKHCLEKLLWMVDSAAALVPIENNKEAIEKINTNDVSTFSSKYFNPGARQSD